jgi:dephospho-CoA kinase
MISIGITGGIGSGKSIVCKVLECLGYPVFYSDAEAKKNMLENLDLISSIVGAFGNEAYIDKQLNRTFLANQIFKKPDLKEKLNALVHPTVFQSFEKWKSQQNSTHVFNESALLFETGSYTRFDEIWLVTADLETRIKRVIKRDNISLENVLERIENQMKDEEKMKFPCKIIRNNDGDLVLAQVLKLMGGSFK